MSNQANKVQAVPEGMHTVTPHLVCDGAAKAIDFYKEAFGAIEVMRVPAPDGRLMHGAVRIGDSLVMLADNMMGSRDPKSLKGTPVVLHLQVGNADAFFDRAVKAGARVEIPLQDMFWGDRYGVVSDPFGHHWSIATHVRDVDMETLTKAAAETCSGCGPG